LAIEFKPIILFCYGNIEVEVSVALVEKAHSYRNHLQVSHFLSDLTPASILPSPNEVFAGHVLRSLESVIPINEKRDVT
jgi:cation transporter-like permease